MSERDIFPIAVTDLDETAAHFNEKLKEEGTWNDLNPTNVGAFVRRMFAGISVSHQHNILVSARNAFYGTALRDSAIMAIARTQGVKIARRGSAATSVEITNTGATTVFVPPFSQHTIGTKLFYNPVQYYVVAGASQTVDLLQGEVRTKTFDLDLITNLSLFEFTLGEPNFNVSEELYVYTTDKNTGNVRAWGEAESGLYEYTADDYVYYQNTTANGDVSLIFGTGEYGAALPRKATLAVRYVYTDGSASNGMLPDIKATYIANPALNGVSRDTTTGGGDPKDATFYRTFGPLLYRSKKKKISATEIRAAILDYPGVADCAVLGQRDIAPEDKTWMNTMRLCVLPANSDSWGGANPNPKSASWENFKTWLHPQLHDRLEIQTWNPTKIPISVRVNVAIFEKDAKDEPQIKSAIMENILKLFKKRPGILQRRVTKSDIANACKYKGVDYVEVLSPLENSVILSDPTSYCILMETPLINMQISERRDE